MLCYAIRKAYYRLLCSTITFHQFSLKITLIFRHISPHFVLTKKTTTFKLNSSCILYYDIILLYYINHSQRRQCKNIFPVIEFLTDYAADECFKK